MAPEDDPGSPSSVPRAAPTEEVDSFERSRIESELTRNRGSVKATIEASRIPRETFYDKLRRHGISAADYR